MKVRAAYLLTSRKASWVCPCGSHNVAIKIDGPGEYLRRCRRCHREILVVVSGGTFGTQESPANSPYSS